MARRTHGSVDALVKGTSRITMMCFTVGGSAFRADLIPATLAAR
jgi:hypothetical protein